MMWPNSLFPLLREKAELGTPQELKKAYHRASLGEIEADTFWSEVGLDANVEDEYLDGHQLMPGLLEFLELVRERAPIVWCLSNDVSRWSEKLRRRHGIEELIDGFVISGDIGIRKPSAKAFEMLIHRCGITEGEVVFVDDQLRNLDAALGKGLSTVMFRPRFSMVVSLHKVVDSYRELGDYLFNEGL